MKRRALLLALLVLAAGACSHSPAPVKDRNALSGSDIYMHKGIQYMEMGMFDVALNDLQRAVQLDERNSEAHDALAVLYQKLDRNDDAEKHFKRAVSLDERNYNAANNYGRFLCEKGHYEDAMGLFRKIIDTKLYSAPWIVLTNAGLCAHSHAKKDQAETYLRQALEANPTFPPALLEMAKLSQESAQYLSARAFLERYEGVAESSSESLRLGMQIESALGNADAAEAYGRALRMETDHRRKPEPRQNPQALPAP